MSAALPATTRPGFRRWAVALAVLSGLTLWLLLRNIAGTVPYPQHVDEPFLTGPAQRTLTTGTLHPYTFNYPSLPKYLATIGMAAGFIRGAAQQGVSEIHQLHSVGFPFYDPALVVQTARQLYALVAVAGVIALGAASWVLLRRPSSLVYGPLFLIATPLFFYHAWAYLNVDIVGMTFVTLTLAAALAGTYEPTLARAAVVPGICAGLATASKYTLAVAIVPVFVAIALFVPRRRRAVGILGAGGAMLGAFLAAVPYSVIDIPGFLNGVASEAFHYASGQRGFQDAPGWPQVSFYARHFLSEFGGATLFAAVGVVVLARRDWRRAAVLLAFPVALLALLVRQRVHFERNVLSVQPFIALCAAAGVLAVYDRLLDVAVRRGWARARDERRAAIAVAVLLAAIAVPWWHVAGELRARIDSRNLAPVWLRDHLPPGWGVAVPEELAFDVRRLEAPGRQVSGVKLQNALDQAALQTVLAAVPRPSVLLVPRWGADRRFPGSESVETLNNLTKGWQTLATFGSQDVLVNSPYASPSGDPAFSIAVLR